MQWLVVLRKELTARRLAAMRRAVIAGWVILAVEMAVLTPWVWYRVHSARSTPTWPWVLLVTMGGSASWG